jgi:DNA-binding response OmpR family regulator
VVPKSMVRHRVLVVDDEQRILNFVRIKLMVSGYDVFTSMTGQDALSMVEDKSPDMVVLDIRLPDTDGLEVLKQIRASSDLPVIVISARIEYTEDALRLGANGFIAKPFHPDELTRKIEAILAKREKYETI